jgi:thiol-disulfide isomerase/thioredoxin
MVSCKSVDRIHSKEGLPMRRFSLVLITLLAMAPPAQADKLRTFTVRQEDGSYCEEDLNAEFKNLKGVKKYRFDRAKTQVVVTLADGVSDQVALDAIKRARARCSMEMGHHDSAPASYPKDADVQVLSKKGESIGALKNHLVPGKYTVFDVYADWCGPCRDVDKKLREIVAGRPDVAVRKLVVLDFDSPLARELGLEMLPHVIVYTPEGKKTEIRGAELGKIDKALKKR